MRSIVAILLALVVAGCGSPAASPPPPSPPVEDPDPQGSWQLASGTVDGEPIAIVEDHPITVTIDGASIGGRACNEYGGRLAPTSGGVEIRDLGSTSMACVDERVMDAEAAYLQAFGRTATITVVDGALVLAGPGTELRFERLPPPPTAELVDTTWALETVFVGDVASPPKGDPATLELAGDGTFRGSTGCRTFEGRWIEQGDQIRAAEMAMDDTECPVALSGQDSHVVTVIGDGFVATVDGDLLTLIDPGGAGLVYRAAE